MALVGYWLLSFSVDGYNQFNTASVHTPNSGVPGFAVRSYVALNELNENDDSAFASANISEFVQNGGPKFPDSPVIATGPGVTYVACEAQAQNVYAEYVFVTDLFA